MKIIETYSGGKKSIKKWRYKMVAAEQDEENIPLTCLTEMSKIIQSAIKKKGLTYEEIDKSYGLVRLYGKRKN